MTDLQPNLHLMPHKVVHIGTVERREYHDEADNSLYTGDMKFIQGTDGNNRWTEHGLGKKKWKDGN